MNGTSSTQFEPNSFVSRAMVVTTLYRMAGSPSSSASVSFTDVSSTDWFYAAVRWSVQYGIANGVTTTTFEPNSMVTREQALTFFLRYLKNFEKRTAYYHYSITYCGDYSQIDSYAVLPSAGRSATASSIRIALQTTSCIRSPMCTAGSLPCGCAAMGRIFGASGTEKTRSALRIPPRISGLAIETSIA